MHERIALHRDDRGPRWTTVEVPLDLAVAITDVSKPGTVVLVDCLTLWASNLMLAERDTPTASKDLVRALLRVRSPVVLVSNEVGLGIVPDNALARRYRDVAGQINQDIATIASEVVMLFSGLPLTLKPTAVD